MRGNFNNHSRKYPKVTGYWVYAHITPEKEVYIGYSGNKYTSVRWQPQLYKSSYLQPYIERFGWENIEHRVLIDGLTKEQAIQAEDWFIKKASTDGFCINHNRSGLISKVTDYPKSYYESHKEEKKNYIKYYYESHKEEKKTYLKAYREAHKEDSKIYGKERRSTPEGKIYKRVYEFNRYHPDRQIETALEARDKYLKSGYIPSYIKNDDLV